MMMKCFRFAFLFALVERNGAVEARSLISAEAQKLLSEFNIVLRNAANVGLMRIYSVAQDANNVVNNVFSTSTYSPDLFSSFSEPILSGSEISNPMLENLLNQFSSGMTEVFDDFEASLLAALSEERLSALNSLAQTGFTENITIVSAGQIYNGVMSDVRTSSATAIAAVVALRNRVRSQSARLAAETFLGVANILTRFSDFEARISDVTDSARISLNDIVRVTNAMMFVFPVFRRKLRSRSELQNLLSFLISLFGSGKKEIDTDTEIDLEGLVVQIMASTERIIEDASSLVSEIVQEERIIVTPSISFANLPDTTFVSDVENASMEAFEALAAMENNALMQLDSLRAAELARVMDY